MAAQNGSAAARVQVQEMNDILWVFNKMKTKQGLVDKPDYRYENTSRVVLILMTTGFADRYWLHFCSNNGKAIIKHSCTTTRHTIYTATHSRPALLRT